MFGVTILIYLFDVAFRILYILSTVSNLERIKIKYDVLDSMFLLI